MIVNFKARGINRDMRKLTQISILIKKKNCLLIENETLLNGDPLNGENELHQSELEFQKNSLLSPKKSTPISRP
jgi:hypothetical protein